MKAISSELWKSFPVRVFGGTGSVMALSSVVTLALYFTDLRVLANQDSVWAKPLKFQFALALHAFALLLVVTRIDPKLRDGRWMGLVALAFLVSSAIEMSYIVYQAAQGEPSHFNDTSMFHRTMFSVMAFCAILIIGAAGAIGLTVMKDARFRAPSPVRLGVVLALTGGTILTLVTAFAIGGNGSPYVGGAPDFSERLRLTGWSTVGGDLRIAHFLSTHMIQVIPLAAIAGSFARPPVLAKGIVLAATGIWVTWTLLEFVAAGDGNVSYLVGILAGLNR